MNYILVPIGVTLQILPCAFLCIYPFWEHAMITRRRILALGGIYIIFLALMTVLMLITPQELAMVPIYTLLIICFFMYRSVVKIQLSKQLYVFFIVAIFGTLAGGITNHLEAIYFPHNFYTYYSGDYIILNTLVMGIIMPVIWIFLRKKVNPVIADNNTAYWKYMWVIPAAILIVLGAYIGVQEIWHISSWQFITILLLLAVLSLAICYISIEMVEQVSRNAHIQTEKEALQRLDLMKSEMAASISHETRTPLAVLSGYAELISMELREQGISRQTVSDLEKISAETRRIADMMEQMQKLATRKDTKITKEPLDIGKIAEQTTRLYMPILKRNNIGLEIKIPDNLPMVLGSTEELTQVIFNLLQNAKNHTDTGTVTVEIKAEDGSIITTIADTGCGIEPDLLPHIFGRGVSGGRHGGSGLGLALCKDIIHSHMGKIMVSSNQYTVTGEGAIEKNEKTPAPAGTAVTFMLPACNDEEGEISDGKE